MQQAPPRDPWDIDPRPVDVLVIGSQVAYGTVGNPAVIGGLVAAGRRTVAVPTTLLSVLPHHDPVHFHGIDDAWLAATLDDLDARGFTDRLGAITIGYLASPAQAEIIGAWLGRLRERAPGVVTVLDPAMGDHDVGVYTDPAVAPAYVEHLVPLADWLTPNVFELGMLTGVDPGRAASPDAEPDDAASPSAALVAAARRLRASGCGRVVVTGLGLADADAREVGLLVCDADGERELRHPRVTTGVKGAGDVFVARLVAGLLDEVPADDAARSAAHAVASTLGGLVLPEQH